MHSIASNQKILVYRLVLVLFFALGSFTSLYIAYRLGMHDAYQVVTATKAAPVFVLGAHHEATSAAVINKAALVSISPLISNELLDAAKTAEHKISDHNIDLWDEVNNYRQHNGLSALTKDPSLCNFVGVRLRELQVRGSLDNHDGYNARINDLMRQNHFSETAENIAQGYADGFQTVTVGWHESLPHRATLLTTTMDVGCSSEGSGFAVLIVGKKFN